MENRRIILPRKKFAESTDETLSLSLQLDESRNLLRENDRNIILNNALLFEEERNESIDYKIHGKLRMVFSNPYSGSTLYTPLRRKLYLNGDGSEPLYEGYMPYEEFAFLRRDAFRYEQQLVSTDNIGDFILNLQPKGESDHINIPAIEAPYHNWNIFLSYVFDKDTSFPMRYTLSGGTYYEFTSADGIPFNVYDLGRFYKLVSDVEHGFKQGEYIILSGNSLTTIPLIDRTFYIDEVGDENYNSQKFVIILSKSEIPVGTNLDEFVLGKRCLDRTRIEETTSEYYIHKHKVLTNRNDYILENLGFESSIWADKKKILFENSEQENDVVVQKNRMETLIYDFKDPFKLSGLTNNLGYLPTEVYVSIVLKNGNGYFTYPPKVGYKFHFHDTWTDAHFENYLVNENTMVGTEFIKDDFLFTSGNTLTSGDTLFGAYVEYNLNELKERVISEAFHKFSTPRQIFDFKQYDADFYSGVTDDNTVGLFYQPHYRIKLRQLSSYIETSSTNQIFDLPQNAKYFEFDSLWRWRDLYPHGFVDPDGFGTTYPFINNMHYIKNDINFYIRSEKDYLSKKDELDGFDNQPISIC